MRQRIVYFKNGLAPTRRIPRPSPHNADTVDEKAAMVAVARPFAIHFRSTIPTCVKLKKRFQVVNRSSAYAPKLAASLAKNAIALLEGSFLEERV